MKRHTIWVAMALLALATMAQALPGASAHPAPTGDHRERSYRVVGAAAPVEFRRGLNGYTGVSDTYLVNESPPKAHGGPSEQQFHIKETLAFGGKRALIKFDLASIPTTAQVLEARLEVYPNYFSASTAIEVRLYHLLKPWSELGATWITTGLGADWAVEGAGGAGDDYEVTPLATKIISVDYRYQSITVTGAVQRWVQTPAMNHGALILGVGNSEVRFWSSDAATESLRPRLFVTYEVPVGLTPSPTATSWGAPTATVVPTPGITGTPPPLTTVYSVSWPEAFDPASHTNCIQAGPSAEAEGQPSSNSDILLVWQGVPTAASLSFRYGQLSYPPHTVLVNGHVIGQVTGAAGGDACSARGSGKISFDPSVLASGRNKVEILNDGRPENSRWGMTHQRIELTGNVQASKVVSVTFVSSFDRTSQRAMIQTPPGYDPEAGKRPLVLVMPHWGARDFAPLLDLAKIVSDKGWLLAASDTRGPFIYTASPAVQHDVVDLLDYMVRSPLYNVDEDRVYIMGTSLGGMMASVVAAKYPDRFAALAEMKGPTRMDQWWSELGATTGESWRQGYLSNELGGTPVNKLRSYLSRSSYELASNLRNIPVLISHSRDDKLVRLRHATDLYTALAPYGRVLEPDIYPGGHADPSPNWPLTRIIDWFGQQPPRDRAPRHVTVRTDESKSYYWLTVTASYAQPWAWVDAAMDPATKTVWIEARDDSTSFGYSKPAAITLKLDLETMGLPTNVGYTVEDLDMVSGAYTQYTLTATRWLELSAGERHRKFIVYPYAAQQPQSLTLRQDYTGYHGVVDTYIRYDAPDLNYANEGAMYLTHLGQRVPLLRFDLAPLPPNVVIKGAQLGLFVGAKWPGADAVTTSIYRLREPWDVGEVNWLRRTGAEEWIATGAAAAGADYDGNAYATQKLDQAGKQYQYNVTELVRYWQANSGSNQGLLVRGEGGNGTFTLSSSESPSNKPELVIMYTYPTATPIPSVTPTPTRRKLWLPAIKK